MGDGHIEQELLISERKVAEKKKKWLEVESHAKRLKGTGFEKCIQCPGATGRVASGIVGEERGKKLMDCSRVYGKVELITEDQAKRCDGKNPLLSDKTETPHSIFKKRSDKHQQHP